MKKKLYFVYLLIYALLFLIEFILYLKFNSTLFGLIYMIVNLVIIILMSFGLYNYSELNLKIRLSKNGILAFFIIVSILISLFKFKDESKQFISSIKVLIYYLKPIMLAALVALSIFDYKVKGNILE